MVMAIILNFLPPFCMPHVYGLSKPRRARFVTARKFRHESCCIFYQIDRFTYFVEIKQ